MTIRKMIKEDKDKIYNMMKEFYNSDAVLTNGSDEIYNNDIDTCISDSPYLEGFVFIKENEIIGYSMIAKSFSTEYGLPCIWLEDLYILGEYRHLGYGSKFFKYLEDNFKNVIIRLEVEEYNKKAINCYKKNKYNFMEYKEMMKIIK